jgi:hypothetical protein
MILLKTQGILALISGNFKKISKAGYPVLTIDSIGCDKYYLELSIGYSHLLS